MENSTRISKTTSIGDIIAKNESQKIGSLKKNIYHKRLFIKETPENFIRLIQLKGERIIREKGKDDDFSIDIYNKDIITDLYYYATGNAKFSGDLHKGLWFWSEEYGTGKTTMLRIMQELFNDFNHKVFQLVECKMLHEIILEKTLVYFRKRTIYFDDIGRERKEINDFGNKTKPIPNIIHLREHEGSWTHATAQRPIESFEPIYGRVTTNRMTAMFNEIEFKGKTRRK
ncbi:MAG: hypothetical protein JEY96_01640 [Bacteroidales bacterium]|nr:hypothetical protein [Bacteroidales bacterium]